MSLIIQFHTKGESNFNMLVSKRTTLFITTLVALLLIASACSSSTSQQSNIPEVVIKASEYAFEAPDQIEAGLTYITMENTGEENHHAVSSPE